LAVLRFTADIGKPLRPEAADERSTEKLKNGFLRAAIALPRATYPAERSEKSVETRVSSTDGGAVRPRGADVSRMHDWR